MENNESKTPLIHEEQHDLVSSLKANKKAIVGLSVAAVVIIAVAFIWFFVAQSNAKKADEAIALADNAANDSIALVLYKDAATMGSKSGNRAKVEVAMRLYQDGKYEEALTYLKDASIDDNIVAAGVHSLTGDCYVNLNKIEDALTAYGKAIKAADENPTIVPLILFKEANIYRSQNNFEAEYEALKQIVDDYPEYILSNQSVDIRKYYERAKAAAGK
jgi:tetratricopeptide (TPR) repeat protein